MQQLLEQQYISKLVKHEKITSSWPDQKYVFQRKVNVAVPTTVAHFENIERPNDYPEN